MIGLMHFIKHLALYPFFSHILCFKYLSLPKEVFLILQGSIQAPFSMKPALTLQVIFSQYLFFYYILTLYCWYLFLLGTVGYSLSV